MGTPASLHQAVELPIGKKSRVSEPTRFIQGLAISVRYRLIIEGALKFANGCRLPQSQVLSCLHLLCDYQVLATIPAQGEIAFEDIADIVGLPDGLLRAVVGMTASVGFFHIPRPGMVAHSVFSMELAGDVDMLDAFAFLAETISPCVARMPELGYQRGRSGQYNLAFTDCSDYNTEIQHHHRLQRQAAAHSILVVERDHDIDGQRIRLLERLDWKSLCGATVVDVDAVSPALAVFLAKKESSLSLVVEGAISSIEPLPVELVSRIRLIDRLTSEQPVQDASIYILHLISPSIAQSTRKDFLDALSSQLALHLSILRQNCLARILLFARVLPETIVSSKISWNRGCGASTSEASDSARCLALYHNLALQQLMGGRDHEHADVQKCVRRTKDSDGALVITNEVRGTNSEDLMAFEIRYLPNRLDQCLEKC